VEGKRLIVGSGQSGNAAAGLLRHFGQAHLRDYFIFDDKAENSDFASSELVFSQAWEEVILSPGYPRSKEWLQKLLGQGTPIISELDLASRYLEYEKRIAITGSVAKSTTAAMLTFALEKVSQRVFLGANFGTPLCTYVLNVLEGRRPRADFLVLELSSFQLESLKMKFDYSLLTPFFPNHLDRYESLEHYYLCKWELLDLTQKRAYALSPGGDLAAMAQRNPNPKLELLAGDSTKVLVEKILRDLGLSQDPHALLKDFKALAHRFELFHDKESRLFINDSKATTLQGVEHALGLTQSILKGKGHLHLLLGGRDKGLPWADLLLKLAKQRIEVYFFGEIAPQLEKLGLLKPSLCERSLAALLEKVSSRVAPGDALLLSPGGVSYDEFKSYAERGDFFKSFLKTKFSCEN
jgi:UDP-N-acetylmuramoylalanine--D-glutamate ligase